MCKAVVTVCTVLAEKSPQALPLGAACIASYIKNSLQKKFDIKVNLKDFTLEDEVHENQIANELAKTAKDAELKIFAFSIFVWNRKLLCDAARLLKRKIPDCVLIAGGPEVTASPESFADFDYVVSGEGERATADLIENLVSSEKFFVEKKSGGCKIIFGKRNCLEALPSPYLDGTLKAEKYGGVLWELARGCPFKCSYCYESKGEKIVDYFPFGRLKKELEFFAAKKIPQVWVLDPTYNANKKRAKQILDEIAKTAPDIFFHFECRSEFLDRELVRAFSKTNCCLQIGLQSADQNVLRLVNRTFDKKDFVKKISMLNQNGIIFGFDLIYGLPCDTLHGFESSIDFAISLYPNHLELFRLSVLPGTSLYDDAEKLGLVFEREAPHHIISTGGFPVSDIEKAERLSRSCDIFYSQGRAVSWFNSVTKLLKMKATELFWKFDEFLQDHSVRSTLESLKHADIEKLQLDFLHSKMKEKNLLKYWDAVSDCIRLNGAISRFHGEGEHATLELHYHSDDLLSECVQDFRFFTSNAQKGKFVWKI